MLITAISDNLYQQRAMHLADVRDVAVPVSTPLTCEVSFEAVRPTSGTILVLSVNGNDVAELTFDHETGVKNQEVDVTDLLTKGRNEFRVRCLVAQLDSESDSATVWLRSGEQTFIRKVYLPNADLEPFDQRWTLLMAESS